MENKIKVLALFGKSGAGKDTIQKWLVNNENVHGIISYTTRRPRDNEKDGVDYHFITKDKFFEKISKDSFLELMSFNGFYYGTSIDSLDENKINVGVFNIKGIETLLEDDRISVLPVYIKCYDKLRLHRCLNRELFVDCYEVCRRFIADEKDFEEIPFKYVSYDNSLWDGYCGILEIPKIKLFIKDINN